jgi:drug/metabolite transporter (DMT)-like permease
LPDVDREQRLMSSADDTEKRTPEAADMPPYVTSQKPQRSPLLSGSRGRRVKGAAIGVGLIVAAVVLITLRKSDARVPRRDLLSGIWIGVVSLFFQAAGIVMFKPILKDVPILQVCLVRMLGGAAGVAAVLPFLGRPARLLRPMFSGKTLKFLLPASVLAAYLSNVIWMGGMKYTLASIASALNQMNTIFVFILAAIFLKEKITPIKLAAVVLAFAGATLVSIPLL